MLEVEVDAYEKIRFDVEVHEGTKVAGDYNLLKNIPTLDGIPIMGDMRERDPTVPEWAKQDHKPSYSANEVNAVSVDDGISIEELARLFEESEDVSGSIF